MAYIDGFLAPVDPGNQQDFLEHAKRIDGLFLEFGATRVVECWADDVPEGKVTDFRKAVAAKDGETVVFAWIEWPDKATRDAAMAKMQGDERMQGPMPFDGKRMIYGGFAPIVDERQGRTPGYIDGFVAPVTGANRDAYLAMAQTAAKRFIELGALRSSENWGDDVPDGTVTDFKRAVQVEPGESVVFSWVEWPDKAARDAGWAKMMSDPAMQPETMPFDGKRMFWGGFKPILILGDKR